MNAQFVDGLEWISGNCPEHWLGNPPLDCPTISTDYVHSGLQSGFVNQANGSSDAILNLGNKTSGVWNFISWIYVPSGKEGYFTIQGEVPLDLGEKIVGNIFFNKEGKHPGEGVIDDTALGAVYFDFPHDQWFRVIMVIDMSLGIDLATWWLYVYNQTVIPIETPFTNEVGDIPTGLGGIQFFAASSNTAYYLDDLIFNDKPLILSANNYPENECQVFPNPVHDLLSIHCPTENPKISIYSQTGQLIEFEWNYNQTDVSVLPNGLYFVQIITSEGKSLQKFIKY